MDERVRTRVPHAVRNLTIVCLALVLVGCSSSGTQAADTRQSATGSAAATKAPVACERYYDWDLYLRTAVGPTDRSGRRTARESLDELRRLTQRLESAVYSAVVAHELPIRSSRDAQRIGDRVDRIWDQGGTIRSLRKGPPKPVAKALAVTSRGVV